MRRTVERAGEVLLPCAGYPSYGPWMQIFGGRLLLLPVPFLFIAGAEEVDASAVDALMVAAADAVA